MRVVGGSAKGKQIQVVPGAGTRPIMDRVKTALFDILRPHLQDAAVLDLFAGSGSVGIEALSQGASHCTFTELGRRAIVTIRKNLELVGFVDRATVRHIDAFTFLRETDQAFDLIYVAPPQYEGIWVQALSRIAERPELVTLREEDSSGLVIAQIDPKEYEELHLTTLHETRQKRYGNTLLVFFERLGNIDVRATGSADVSDA